MSAPLGAAPLAASSCEGCGTQVAPTLLSCPSCGRLVHAAELKRLADEADSAERGGDPSGALSRWREALELLPPASRQFEAVAQKVDALSRVVTERGAGGDVPHAGERPALAKRGGIIGTAALLLWKFKVVLFLVLSKAKLLLLGLTKVGTLWTMLLSMGLYMRLYGWAFGVGLVVSIYIHEMGHVAALRRYGIKAGAPMFIPGLGALIRLRQLHLAPREDARVGLAGPVWGFGAAIAALALWQATGAPAFAVIARWGAVINLFNLVPIWQLDGSRGFHALTRAHRWAIVAAAVALWMATSVGWLGIIALVGAYRAAFTPPAAEPDTPMLGLYALLLAALSAIAMVGPVHRI